jgi:hypothetical protein
MLPKAFQSQRVLEHLNALGVGLAMASMMASVFDLKLVLVLPTIVLGACWTRLLRSERLVTRARVRIGWLLSPFLAMLNAAVSCAITGAGYGGALKGAAVGALVGLTAGAVVWFPALIFTLLFIGTPIAWSQRLARRGLAGAERGEGIVALACLVISMFAFVIVPKPNAHHHFRWGHASPGLAVAGISVAIVAGALSLLREHRRRRFVRQIEAGELTGYRVDVTKRGKLVVRVPTGEGYRSNHLEEDLYALDEAGEAVEPAAPQAAVRRASGPNVG